MKKFLLGFMSALVSATMMADPIDMEKAKSLAISLMPTNAEPVLVKTAVRNEAKSRTLDESVKATAPYYIFSRGENQGFIIVSGDDCLPEILGYTESGDFDEESLPPHLLNWLNHYATLIEDAQAQGANTPNEARTRATIEPTVRTATKTDIDPLVTAHWHQSGPYNNLCPFITGTTNRAVTGCVATAAAQVIYHWRKDNPSTLLATTPTYTYGSAPVTVSYPKGTPMKWDLMLDNYNGSRPAEYDEAVATFNAAVGAGTWLTYGSSTAGQIRDLVNTFNSYFRMSSECLYKWDSNQTDWETKIYNELANGRPIVYSGVHATSGGHAVVLDGYKASTNLYHFNFGWGGQGDGWYTVNDENGMNGFNESQGMVYKIQPKVRNIGVKIIRPEKFHLNRTNDIRIKVSNNSTLNFSGVYLFLTTGSKPSSLPSAKDEDVATVFTNDGSDKYITLSCKPTLDRTYTIWVTDDKLTVLDSDTLTPTSVKSELQLLGIDILGSNQIETYNGEDFKVVYNPSKATCEIEIANISENIYEGSPKINIHGSKDNGATFELVGTKTGKIAIEAGKSQKAEINITSTSSCPLEPGTLYCATVVNPITSLSSDDTLQYVNSDTIARFILKESDLAIASYENRCLKFTGNWDFNKFTSLSNGKAYADATSFDLTEVTGIGSQPVFENNPNALFYVADDAFTSGYNIVKKSDSSCANLTLTAGYDFQPLGDINVANYTFNLSQEPNHWYQLTSPCTVEIPHGIIAREVNAHSKLSGITQRTTDVTTLEAGKTYLVMTSSAKKQTLTSAGITCLASPVVNADPSFIGTYVGTTLQTGAMLIDHTDDYFSPIEEGAMTEGLRGYFYDEATTRRFRAYSNMQIDNECLTLGLAIDSCYTLIDEYHDIVTEEAQNAFMDSIAAAEKIFSERTLSAAELKSYISKFEELIESYKLQINITDVEGEKDCTGFIVNPSFELGSTTGWTVEDKTIASAKATSNLYYKGVGSDGAYLLNNLNLSDSTGIAISQTVEGLVPGTYRLTAMVGTSEGRTVTMFANDNKVAVDAHTFGKFYLTEAVIENIVIGEEGTLNLGIEAGDWYKADDFRLTLIEENVADGISDIPAKDNSTPVAVVPVAGGVSITTFSTIPVTIHNTAGIRVWSNTVRGTATVSLPSGIYIIAGKKVAVY